MVKASEEATVPASLMAVRFFKAFRATWFIMALASATKALLVSALGLYSSDDFHADRAWMIAVYSNAPTSWYRQVRAELRNSAAKQLSHMGDWCASVECRTRIRRIR